MVSGFLYVGATLALLLAMPPQAVSVVQGVVEGVDKMSGRMGIGWVVGTAALLMAISMVGATSAWLSGSARILFVSGIDRYLPKVFGRIHPRYGTPHVAIVSFAAFSSALIGMSFLGKATVKEAYVTLLDLAVVLQMISYLYLYASLAKVAFSQRTGGRSHGRLRIQFAAVAGLVTTSTGLIVGFVPPRHVDSVLQFELKMLCTCALFLGLAGGLFAYYSRHQAHAPAIAAEV